MAFLCVQQGEVSGIEDRTQREEESPPRLRRHWLWWLGGGVLMVVLIGFTALLWVAHNAEPLLRARVVRTMQERFHRPVELDALHLSVIDGLQVEGEGLRVLRAANPPGTAGAPLLTIRSFTFRSGLRELLDEVLHGGTMQVASVRIQGAELRIPPSEERGALLPKGARPRGLPREEIHVDRLVFDEMRIVIETRRPGKAPLEFAIANLTLTNVGRLEPFAYDATVRNPKPVGDVRSVGHFGPWDSESPQDTPLDGSYIFSHADLSTIHGLGGTLSSNGRFAGSLGRIAIDGVSDTPDFRLSTSGHVLPLYTVFHAVVDATSGDTYLQPVRARLERSEIVATGSVTRTKGVPGHDVELDVVIGPARIDDLLALGVRTYPPVLRGGLTAKAHISIPQGAGTVARRMRLQGSFRIDGATFSNPRLQTQIDQVSERALGWPERANRDAPVALATMEGSFALADERMNVPAMTFVMPGATVQVEGSYGLDGAAMDFHGLVRTQATASEMVGGWKQLLVMPFDHYLKKNGAGMEVPFKLGGTQKDPKLGLDFGRYGTKPH